MIAKKEGVRTWQRDVVPETSLKSSAAGDPAVAPRRRWRWLLWTCGVLALVASLGPLYWVAVRWRASQRIEAEIARIRAAGEPTTYEEVIQAIPPLPPEQDCTALYQAVFAEINTDAFYARAKPFPIVGESEEFIPPPGTEWPNLAAAAEFVDSQRHLFEKLDQVEAMGGQSRFPITVADVEETGNAHRPVFKCRSATRLLELRAFAAAQRGDADVVFRSLMALLALPECLAVEPDLAAMPSRWSLNHVVNSDVAYLVGSVRFSDEQLAAMQSRIRHINYTRQLRANMLTERVWILDTLKQLKQPYHWLGDIEPEDVEAYLFGVRRICDATKATDLFTMADQIERAQADVRTTLNAEQLDSGGYDFTNVFVLGADFSVSFIVDAVRRNRILDAFLACERYRLAHDVYPTSVDQLVPQFLPAVPDPKHFHGPLRILQDGEDLVVYSVGEDGKDAGGELMGHGSNADDMGYRTNTWKRDYEEYLAEQAAQPQEARDETEPVQ